MKGILKAVVSLALAITAAITMSLSAFAATADDAVAACKAAGVQGNNVVMLENFFKTATFTSDEYQLMIDTVNQVKDTYVVDTAMELFGKTPGELTENEKVELGRTWTAAEKQSIINALVTLGEKVDVVVSVEMISKSNYNVTATIKNDDSTNSNSSNPGGTTVGGNTNPVANTGVESERNYSMFIALAAILVLSLGTVTVIVRKNRE